MNIPQHENGFLHIYNEETGEITKRFNANGTEYFVRLPSDGISLLRASKLRPLLSVVGNDATFGDQLQAEYRKKKLFDSMLSNKGGATELGAEIMTSIKAIEKADRNWTFAAYACTLFIVTENEDLPTYDERTAEKKIEDWNKEPIHEQDFFFLCLSWARIWNEGLAAFYLKLAK